jgi:FAD/FMN-containing dehydrogenase
MTEHERMVQEAARAVGDAVARGATLAFTKSSVSHFVPDPYRRDRRPRVDLSGLDRLLAIDPEARTATAEPGLTFADLTRETLKHGLLPTVVPELETITVGGAVAGCSIESMSYRYGGFHDACVEYEVLTGTGEVLTLSREKEPELFEMVHGSYGTLARLTKVTFRLVPAKPFVHLTYRTHTTLAAFEADLRARCDAGDFDFVDGIVHAPDKLVLCLGRMVDQAPRTSSYRGTGIFYKSTARLAEDWMTTWEYCFRYDREAHWMTATIPPLQWRWVRATIGRPFLGSTNLIRWSGRLAPILRLKKRPEVVVDVFLPARRFGDFFSWYVKDFDFWPLWIVPYRIERPYPWISDEHAARMGDTLMIDAAVYGKPNDHPTLDASEVLERKVFELDGIKTLISRNHYDEQRFWQIYSKPRYDAAKQRLDPHHVFGDLYTRFRPRS